MEKVRGLLLTLAWLILAGLALATLLALFARSAWVFELATHFRLQYVVLLAALGATFLLLRRPVAAGLAAVLLLPNGWYVAPYLLPLTVAESVAAPTAGRDVSIVGLNLYYRNQDFGAVRDYLAARDADILVLSELTPGWVVALHEVTEAYPYRLSVDRTNPWGLGVYSKYPLREAGMTGLGLAGSVNVSAVAVLPGGDVHLVGVHLASPTTPQRAATRNGQLERLASLLGPPRQAGESAPPPRLLVGDMNLTPFSPYFGDFLQRTGMVDARRRYGPAGTWPAWFKPLLIPIDHCIADPNLPIASVRNGSRVGSDHYPIEILLRQRG